MGLFAKSPTLEENLTAAQASLETASAEVTRLTSELAAANQRATEFETQLSAATDRASKAEADLETERTASTQRAAEVRTALQLEETTELSAGNIRSAIETIAGRKAVELAASQGVPALPTKASTDASNDDEEIKALREQAAKESSPKARAELHARANRLQDAKKSAGKN